MSDRRIVFGVAGWRVRVKGERSEGERAGGGGEVGSCWQYYSNLK